MTLPSGEEEEEEEEQEKEVHKTSAMHTAAAAQQWEESMKHLKHALNQCDEETKVSEHWVKERKDIENRMQSTDRGARRGRKASKQAGIKPHGTCLF